MLEDELLKLRLKAGSIDALQRIYEKYRDHLLTLSLLNGNLERRKFTYRYTLSDGRTMICRKASRAGTP